MLMVSLPTWNISLVRRLTMSKKYRNFKKRKDSKNKVNLWKDRMENSSRKYSTFQNNTEYAPEITIKPLKDGSENKKYLHTLFKVSKISLLVISSTILTITMQFSPFATNFDLLFFVAGFTLYILALILLAKKLKVSKYMLSIITVVILIFTSLGLTSQVTIGDKVYLRYSKTAYIYNESKFLLSKMYEVQNNTNFLQNETSFISANQGGLTDIINNDKNLITRLSSRKYSYDELAATRDLLINALVNQITASKYLENEIAAHDDKNISNIINYINKSNDNNKNAATELGNFTNKYGISLEELNNE